MNYNVVMHAYILVHVLLLILPYSLGNSFSPAVSSTYHDEDECKDFDYLIPQHNPFTFGYFYFFCFITPGPKEIQTRVRSQTGQVNF